MSRGLVAVLARLDRLGRLLEDAALVILLTSMILLAVGQIALREFFGTGLIWADELVRLMVLWLAMLGSVAACRDNRHIRIDVLSHILPARLVVGLHIVADLFAAGTCAVIAWHAFRYLGLEIEFEDTILVDTPAWIGHVIVPVAFALTGYRFLVLVIKRVVGLTLLKTLSTAK